jgi:HNH endonuclease
MASGDRFYQLALSHRAALHGDIGSLLKIEGIVIGGEGAQVVMMLPGNELQGASTVRTSNPMITPAVPVKVLTPEEWSDWLQRSDNPDVLVNDSLGKAFHRKLRYEISGAVQQKVWVADGCKCMYCGQPMGKVQLTIDHFIPLEMGGRNDPSNYLSACRKCNKDKGGMSPQDWCLLASKTKRNFVFYVDYLEHRQLP